MRNTWKIQFCTQNAGQRLKVVALAHGFSINQLFFYLQESTPARYLLHMCSTVSSSSCFWSNLSQF